MLCVYALEAQAAEPKEFVGNEEKNHNQKSHRWL